MRPEAEIRRFDVFAEWNRIKALRQLGFESEAEAQSYGLAVAKVVAARKLFGYKPKEFKTMRDQLLRMRQRSEAKEPWWERLAPKGEYDRKIIRRMGEDFYYKVFRPTIEKLWNLGKRYEEIRDTIRQPWNAGLTRHDEAAARSQTKRKKSR